MADGMRGWPCVLLVLVISLRTACGVQAPALQWKVPVTGEVTSLFAEKERDEQERLYAASTDMMSVSQLFAIENGKQAWTQATGNEGVTVPVAAEGRVVTSAGNPGTVRCYKSTGELMWRWPISHSHRNLSNPVYLGEGLVAVADSLGTVVALSLQRGVVAWDVDIHSHTHSHTHSHSNEANAETPISFFAWQGHLIVVYPTEVVALNERYVMWRTAVTDPLGAVGADAIYVGTSKGIITINRNQTSFQDLGGPTRLSAPLDGLVAYSVSGENATIGLVNLFRADPLPRIADTSRVISAPTLSNNAFVYFVSHLHAPDGKVYETLTSAWLPDLEIVWTVNLSTHPPPLPSSPTYVPSTAVVTDEFIYVGTLGREVRCYPTITFTRTLVESPEHPTPMFSVLFAVLGAVGVVIIMVIIILIWSLRRRRLFYQPRKVLEPMDVGSRYQVVHPLGQGGFGTVYLVRRRPDGAHLALKYVSCPTYERQEDALKEFQVLREVQGHPNMIRVIETFMSMGELGGLRSSPSQSEPLLQGVAAQYMCIVMPYYREGDLRKYISCGRIPEETIWHFVAQLASVLQYLHRRPVPLVHRDLKPENILLDDDRRTLIVTDFGLARPMNTTRLDTHAGTPACMAPEMFDPGHYGKEVDLWALGCVAYSLTTRTTPYLHTKAHQPTFQEKCQQDVLDAGYSLPLARLTRSLLHPVYSERPLAEEVLAIIDSPGHEL